jgi:signal transduction histidine kinase
VTGLTRLVEDLRTLSLADAGELTLHRQETAAGQLLQHVQQAYAHQAQQRDIELQVEAEPELPAVTVDPERMRQVLGNLVSNALRHTGPGGEVALSATHSNSSGLLLTVRDSGAGISPEDLPHVFDRFYRGDKARGDGDGASGLGLAIARSLVEMHNGTITVESTPGKGTTFLIRLPSEEPS